MTTQIIRFPEIESHVGLSRSLIYDKMEKGTFPKPIKLSERLRGWMVADIEQWLSERERNGVSNPGTTH